MKKKILVFLSIVLLLNIVWEFSHYGLYNDLSSIKGPPHLILASLTDALIIFIIYLIISIFEKRYNWIENPDKNDYLFFAGMTLFAAVIIEVLNLNLGRWSYKETMPTIFGIGLSPLLQLATTGILSLKLTSKFHKS